MAIISVDKRVLLYEKVFGGEKKTLKFALETAACFEETRASFANRRFPSTWSRNLFLERPCMYFGSDVVVSCRRADAARFKMDACTLVCLRLC